MSENKKPVSRRSFLKKTGGMVLAAGATAGGLAFYPGQTLAAEPPKTWDEEYDVVIFGTGFAGLAAAIEAAKAGAKTVVLEKMKLPGGNSAINGGVMAVAGSEIQKAEGVEDSPELMIKDMLKAGLGLNHVDLAKMVAGNSNSIYQWLKDDLKVEFQPKPPIVRMGGHSVARSVIIKGATGFGIVKKELDRVEEMGIPIRKQVCLSQLYKDEQGRVVGAMVREGYKFPEAESGQVKNIRAKRGIIMATGGFSRDLFFRTMQDPRLLEEVDSTNQPGATAEGLLAMLECGASPVQLSWIQLGPWASPDEKGFGMAPHFATEAFIHGMLVNPKTGKRIVNELGDRKVRADAILATENYCVIFADADKILDNALMKQRIPRMIEKGVAKQLNTLDQLAAAYNIPAEELKKEVELYNGYHQTGLDKDFGKPFIKGTAPIGPGPYLAVRLWPKVHHTMGGAFINQRAEVLDLHGKPIPGLYAAGEVTGGIHGACRLGSVATTECLVFGRLAGQNAAGLKA